MQTKFKQLEAMLNILGFDIVSKELKGREERKVLVNKTLIKTLIPKISKECRKEMRKYTTGRVKIVEKAKKSGLDEFMIGSSSGTNQGSFMDGFSQPKQTEKPKKKGKEKVEEKKFFNAADFM